MQAPPSSDEAIRAAAGSRCPGHTGLVWHGAAYALADMTRILLGTVAQPAAPYPDGAGLALGVLLSADYFLDNADYTLRWPPEVFAKEVQLLVRRGSQFGIDDDWEAEVDLLLRQAFVSSVPAEDFERIPRYRRVQPIGDEEPF